MTLTPLERRARRKGRGREGLVRWSIGAALVLVVFALGIALGQALHDNPKPGGTVTLEQTVSIPSTPPGSTVTP